MREVLRCAFFCLQGTQSRASGSGRGKPVRFSLVFTAYLSFQENRRFLLVPRVVLKPLVSLIGRLVACSARHNTQHRHRNCNLRCACAPRGHAGARAHATRSFHRRPGSEGLNTLLTQERSRVVNSEMAEGKDGVNKES